LEACPTRDHEPRAGLCSEKKQRDRLIQLALNPPAWALGWAAEVWWRRLAQPEQQRWTEPEALPKRHEWERARDEPTPNALACYGLWVRRRPGPPDHLRLRFVDGRPVSAVTQDCLAWCHTSLAAQGITALRRRGDHASWHKSQAVRSGLRAHHQRVKRTGQGRRMVSCWLPVKSPWLNPIEPPWVHGKRAVAEAERLLSAAELEARVYAYYMSLL
jgi:DDE superfamily endonuclease